MKTILPRIRSLGALSPQLKALFVLPNLLYVLIHLFSKPSVVANDGFLNYIVQFIFATNAGVIFYIITVYLPSEKRRDLSFKLLNNLLLTIAVAADEPLYALGEILTNRGQCIQFSTKVKLQREDFIRLFTQIDIANQRFTGHTSWGSYDVPNLYQALRNFLPKMEAALTSLLAYSPIFDEILASRISSLHDNMVKLRESTFGPRPGAVLNDYYETWYDAWTAYNYITTRFAHNLTNFHYFAVQENKIKYAQH